MREFTVKMLLPENLGLRFVRACAVEMHMDIAEDPSKMPQIKIKENSRGRLFASLRSRNALGHVAILCENL